MKGNNLTIDLKKGDCLELMKVLKDNSIDMVLADLPYGPTSSKLDTFIPFEPLWEQYWRVLKPTGIICLTASQPFTSSLIMSQVEYFKHEWVWIKNRGSNFANTVREPMKEHEQVVVFSKGKWNYNRQMQERTGGGLARAKYGVEHNAQKRDAYRKFEGRKKHEISKLRVPSTWQKFNVEVGLHPTQKPVALFEYLIKTYTNENETVLDNCMGSGTTAIACMNLNRNFVGMEIEDKYFETAVQRWSALRDKHGDKE